MKKNVLCGMTTLALLAGLSALPGHGEESPKLRQMMQKKLEHSQKVLEGITQNDFDKIAKHAEEMILISKSTEWMVLKTPQYELHSNEFRRIAESLIQNAKDKNLDGAALAYLDLTMNCVKCHKYVREVRTTRLDRPSPSEVVEGPHTK